MRFIISSTALFKQLQLLIGALSSNASLPILENFLFEIEKGQLTITASDLETTMTTVIEVDSVDVCKIAIPAKFLMDTLKTFPEQPLTFSIDDQKFGIEILSDYGKYKLTGHNAAEFPRIPGIQSSGSIEMDSKILSEAITKTLFATGNDELRPVMSGVFCNIDPAAITFVSTDAHKLVRYRRTDSPASVTASFILPKKPLGLLKNILANVTEKVTIEFNQTNAYFSFIGTTLICRLIDGKYPNYEAVIPTVNPNKLTVDRLRLRDSIRRVSNFANKSTHQVRLKITGSELNVSAEDIEISNEASERLNCQYIGEDMEIGFNSIFIMEMLSNIGGESVTIEMSAPSRAGILLPSEPESDKSDTLMLVMPVMLNS